MVSEVQIRQFFAPDYGGARAAFLAAAASAGAIVETFRNPHAPSEDVCLATDVAVLGSSDADHVLVLISGTHGVEGFAGSAVQVGLLRTGIAERLSPHVRILMIHALNPYGFAMLRRSNEENIDLNRNFLDHSRPHPQNLEYDKLSGALSAPAMAGPTNFWAILRIYGYLLRYGRARLQGAVTGGQYSHPRGLFFGGHKAAWSNKILHEIVARYLDRTVRLISVDVHTGLGPYGYGEVILIDAEDTPAYRRAVDLWGRERVRSTVSGKSVSAHLSGTINLAFARMLPEAVVTAVGLEFGTLPAFKVFNAMRRENWLHCQAGREYPGAARIKRQLLRAFYPNDERWQRKVWEQGCLVTEQALAGLDNMSGTNRSPAPRPES